MTRGSADETLPTAAEAPGGADIVAGARWFDRYVLQTPLGRGGAGTVWSARDEVYGDVVAMKFVAPLHEGARRQLRRELAVLCLLRTPGVVRMRDERGALRHHVLITDLVTGRPFTRAAEGRSWVDWWPAVVRLVDVLARVHLSGLVHRDIKPANVLVDDAGWPTVLDFGLAEGAWTPREGGGIEGTPRYMAPEQRQPDRRVDARADLYAVAAMVFEMASGRPFAGPDSRRTLEGLALPETVRDVLYAMLAPDPEDRPASALDVLRAWDLDPLPDPTHLLGAGPWTATALQRLFVDVPESLTHVAEDASRRLFEAAHGAPRGTVETLRSWILSGLARWSEDGRVALTRSDLRKLDPPDELVARLARDEDPPDLDEIVDDALARARAAADAGALDRAVALLEAIAPLARGRAVESRLVLARIAYLLQVRSPVAIDEAIHLVTTSRLEPPLGSALLRLLRAARSALTGRWQTALPDLAPDPNLPPWFRLIQAGWWVKAARRADIAVHDRAVQHVRTVAPAAEGDGALAILRYRQGRFREAAELAEHAARASRTAGQQTNAGAFAAACWLEVGEMTRAQQRISEVEAVAKRHRLAPIEDEARFQRRIIAYRQGARTAAQPVLVDAAAELGRTSERRMAFVEALVAWRNGQLGTARKLAARACSALPLRVTSPLALLAHAFAAMIRAVPWPGPPLREVDLDGQGDEIGVQLVALHVAAGLQPDLEWARTALTRLPRSRTARLDVLTLAECVVLLNGLLEDSTCET